MDNGNYEQQFTQNLNAGVPMQPVGGSTDSSRLPHIIAIALAAVILVESIVLMITLNNYFSVMNGDNFVAEESEIEDTTDYTNNFTYDDDGNLIALKVTCVAKDGSSYSLDLSNNYKFAGTGTSASDTGTYTISNDSLVSLSDGEKVLYYDGINLADGLTIYNCDEGTTSESDVE